MPLFNQISNKVHDNENKNFKGVSASCSNEFSFLSIDTENTIKIWSRGTNKYQHTLSHYCEESCRIFGYHPTISNTFYLVTDQSLFSLVDINKRKPTLNYRISTDYTISSADWNNYGTALALIDINGTIFLLDPRNSIFNIKNEIYTKNATLFWTNNPIHLLSIGLYQNLKKPCALLWDIRNLHSPISSGCLPFKNRHSVIIFDNKFNNFISSTKLTNELYLGSIDAQSNICVVKSELPYKTYALTAISTHVNGIKYTEIDSIIQINSKGLADIKLDYSKLRYNQKTLQLLPKNKYYPSINSWLESYHDAIGTNHVIFGEFKMPLNSQSQDPDRGQSTPKYTGCIMHSHKDTTRSVWEEGLLDTTQFNSTTTFNKIGTSFTEIVQKNIRGSTNLSAKIDDQVFTTEKTCTTLAQKIKKK